MANTLKLWINSSCTIAIMLSGRGLNSAPAPGASEVHLVERELSSFVKEFIDKIPRAASQGYHPPTEDDASGMRSVVSLIMANELEQAQTKASEYHYEVIQLRDLDSKNISTVLFERPDENGAWRHAWGLFAFAPDSPGHIIVEAPHPLADINTEQAAIEIFKTGRAKALLIAGAHRDANVYGAADMAHAQSSVFQAIHQWFISPGIIIYQPHGFDQNKYPRYGEIVVSAGVPSPTDLQKKLVQDLMEIGFRPCLFDGRACEKLGATRNVQGISAWKNASDFIHTEINLAIRDDPEKLRLLMNAIANTLDQWTPDLPEDALADVLR